MPYSYFEIIQMLKSAGIENPRYEAGLLLEKFCGEEPALVMCKPHCVYNSSHLDAAIQLRMKRYPLQYILNETGFRNGIFTVTPDTLVPRPDTEMLVEYAVHNLPANAVFADLCTGSGCIAISILSERPDLVCCATDIHQKTLDVAKINACRNGVSDRLTFIRENVDEPLIIKQYAPFEWIISNPPYIATETIDKLAPEALCEPRVALDGGKDGLVFYRIIVKKYRQLLKNNGTMLFEIGYDQKKDIIKIAEENDLNCLVEDDYGKNSRMAVLTFIT